MAGGTDITGAEISTNFRALTLEDLNSQVNHEPRVGDQRLAEALGFERPDRIKSLIERHRSALERFGLILTTVVKNPGRGRPGKTYWLNKRQALYLCTKSEAPLATETTIQMVEVFDAWQAGELERREKPVMVKAHRRSCPRRFEKPSEFALDLLQAVRSANYRVKLGGGRLDFGTAFAETMEDIIARIGDPVAPTRGAIFDWDQKRASEDLALKLRAEGKDVKMPAFPRKVPEHEYH